MLNNGDTGVDFYYNHCSVTTSTEILLDNNQLHPYPTTISGAHSANIQSSSQVQTNKSLINTNPLVSACTDRWHLQPHSRL